MLEQVQTDVTAAMKAGDKPARKGEPGRPGDRTPRRADLLGKWYGDDNGLAQVLFTLDLKDDGTFVLERRDTAPKFEATTHGAWELDSDRPAVILRGKWWVEDGKPVEGRKEQTESLAVTRKDGQRLLTHPVHGKYVRHEAPEETDRPARRGLDDK